MREIQTALVALVIALAVAVLSVHRSQPSVAAIDGGGAETFSIDRAMQHVVELSGRPRPVGSAAHVSARRYIMDELEDLGLETELQRETVVLDRGGGSFLVGRVTNVLARLPGSGATQISSRGARDSARKEPGAVALLAHYDSRPQTPGAGDDASGAAVVLETVRLLASGERPARDVIVIMTDAEEVGLLGARAFVAKHPWLNDISFLLNVEARGNRGPSMMFETTEGNLAVIRAFAAAVERPSATSVSYEVYRRMPNDSDFSVFRGTGVDGLNFAFIGNYAAYHTMLDSSAALDTKSVAHQGYGVSQTARFLANLDAPASSGEDAVYFSLPGGRLVAYPASTGRTLSWAVLAMAGLALWRTSRSALWSAGDLVRGLVLFVGAVAAALVVGSASWQLAELAPRWLLEGPHGRPYRQAWLAAGGGLVLVSLVSLLARYLAPRGRRLGTLGGVLLGWTAITLGLSQWMAGAGYLFCWPSAAGWIAWWIVARAGGEKSAPTIQLATLLGAIPGIVLIAPTLPIFLDALTLSGAAAPGALLALVLTMLTPQLAVLGSRARWVAAVALVGLLVFGGAVAASRPSPERPRVDTLFYYADASGSFWMSFDDLTDEWTETFLGRQPERLPTPAGLFARAKTVLGAPAPQLALGAPIVVEASDSAVEVGRRLRIESGLGGQALRVAVSAGSRIEGLVIDGERLDLSNVDRSTRLTLLGEGARPWDLAVELAEDGPLELEVVEQRFGLPVTPGSQMARPPHLIPSSGWRTDSTFVGRNFTVE